MTARNLCRYPGCRNGVTLSNATGLCTAHKHIEGHCNCQQCAQREPKPAQRSDRIKVAVPYATCAGSTTGIATVTMPKPPFAIP